MNRFATVAIAATAVAGIAGGTFAATAGLGADDRDPGRPPSSGGASKDPGPVPLYLEGREIVDGDTRVRVSGLTVDNVRGLERVSGGWLVVTGTSPQEPAFRGTYVDEDGATTELGDFFGTWDVDTSGDRLVAQFDDTYEVRDVTTGETTREVLPPQDRTPAGNAQFAGADVLTAWTEEHGVTEVFRTDATSGRRKLVASALFEATTSPDGTLLAGEQPRGHEVTGPTCLAGGPVDDLGGASGWETCDWASYGLRVQFSPDSSRLLAVPYDTEGFGPTSYAALDARTGEVTGRIEVPELAVDAAWGDDETVYLHGFADFEMTGGVLWECTIDGPCTEIASSEKTVFLGS